MSIINEALKKLQAEGPAPSDGETPAPRAAGDAEAVSEPSRTGQEGAHAMADKTPDEFDEFGLDDLDDFEEPSGTEEPTATPPADREPEPGGSDLDALFDDEPDAGPGADEEEDAFAGLDEFEASEEPAEPSAAPLERATPAEAEDDFDALFDDAPAEQPVAEAPGDTLDDATATGFVSDTVAPMDAPASYAPDEDMPSDDAGGPPDEAAEIAEAGAVVKESLFGTDAEEAAEAQAVETGATDFGDDVFDTDYGEGDMPAAAAPPAAPAPKAGRGAKLGLAILVLLLVGAVGWGVMSFLGGGALPTQTAAAPQPAPAPAAPPAAAPEPAPPAAPEPMAVAEAPAEPAVTDVAETPAPPTPPEPQAEPAAAPAPVEPEPEPAPVQVAEAPAPAPPPAPATTDVEALSARLKINAIRYNDAEPRAIVNLQRVHEGDTVDGVRVVSIERDRILFEADGTRFTLRF